MRFFWLIILTIISIMTLAIFSIKWLIDAIQDAWSSANFFDEENDSPF